MEKCLPFCKIYLHPGKGTKGTCARQRWICGKLKPTSSTRIHFSLSSGFGSFHQALMSGITRPQRIIFFMCTLTPTQTAIHSCNTSIEPFDFIGPNPPTKWGYYVSDASPKNINRNVSNGSRDGTGTAHDFDEASRQYHGGLS